MPSKRFAIDFKLPCRVSAPSYATATVAIHAYRDALPACVFAPGHVTLPRCAVAFAIAPRCNPRPLPWPRCLRPLVAFVRCLRHRPSKTAVQDRSPRPLSPSPPMPSSAPGLRLRSMPCHACSDAQLPSPSPPMQSCSLPAMAMSRYRDAQLPSPSPPMQSCSLPAMAMSRYRCLHPCHRLLAPGHGHVMLPRCAVAFAGHRHRCSRSPRCPQTDKRPQTVRQKTLDFPEELSARVTLRPDACIHPFVRSRRHRHRCSPKPLPCKTVALSRHLSPSPCPDIHPFPMPASIACSLPAMAMSRYLTSTNQRDFLARARLRALVERR